MCWESKQIFSSRIGGVLIDCDDLTILDFWFEYVGSQSKYSQFESVVSSSREWQWVPGRRGVGGRSGQWGLLGKHHEFGSGDIMSSKLKQS